MHILIYLLISEQGLYKENSEHIKSQGATTAPNVSEITSATVALMQCIISLVKTRYAASDQL
jgi:hypothetical protein